jgi:hypothetical protein
LTSKIPGTLTKDCVFYDLFEPGVVISNRFFYFDCERGLSFVVVDVFDDCQILMYIKIVRLKRVNIVFEDCV